MEQKLNNEQKVEVKSFSQPIAKPHVARSLNVSTAIELKDYLHFYIGGICRNIETGEEFELTPKVYLEIMDCQLNALPVLYNFWTLPLSFWKELKELAKLSTGCFMSSHEILKFMFKSQYDFFGLTELGLSFLRLDTDLGKRVYKEQTFEWPIEPKPNWFFEVPMRFCQTAFTHKILHLEEIENHLQYSEARLMSMSK
jgi:hypothetical protein